MKRRRHGFTMIETMAVVIGLALVLTAVIGAYQGIQSQALAAAAATDGPRRATALLDRMAHELEGTLLVKKPDALDPLDHPWLFLAESQSNPDGADRLRFQTRSHRPRSNAAHVSDLLDVAWFVTTSEDGQGQDLWRWSSSQLPERLERNFPRSDAPGSEAWAHDIARFGVRLLDAEGAWVEEWDSSTLVRSSELPVAAEISVTFDSLDERLPAETYSRRVNLVLGVLDLEAALEPDEADFDDDPGAAEDEDAPFDEDDTDDVFQDEEDDDVPPGAVPRAGAGT